MTLASALNRQDRLWLPGLALPTVLSVEDAADDYKRAFASVLVVLRAESGLGSQGTVAAMVPTSEATYRRWESLEHQALPDAREVARLCELFECEPDDLIHPEPLNAREVQLARRVARASKRGVRRGRANDA